MTLAPSLLPRHCCYRLHSSLRLTRNTSGPRSLFCFGASHSLYHTPGGPKNQKYEKNPNKYWDEFYKRHNSKFFKDRHYLEKDWGEYFSGNLSSESERVDSEAKVVLEVGCGAGNTLFPLLAAFPDVFVHACDFSPHAVSLVKAHGAFRSDRVNAFLCDVTMNNLCKQISPASIDVVTMIFMLSAVSPVKMPLIIKNIKNVLKPSGIVLFRDYAMGDFAQEKLANKDQMISENFYVRGDGTCAFYFSEDSLSTLFQKNGFNTVEVSVYCKQIENRSRKVLMDRRWIRAAFCNIDHPESPPKNTLISTC